jgi:hypothetical protein
MYRVGFACASANIWFLSLLAAPTMAQGKAGDYIEVTKWVSEVVFGDRIQRLGEFSTQDEAEMCSKKWNDENPRNNGLTRERQVKERRYLPRPAAPNNQPDSPSKPPRIPGEPVPATLAGSSFSGSESLNGYGSLTFKFLDGQRVIMSDARETVQGRWEKAGGNTVYLYFYNDKCIYRGSLTGNLLQGTARSPNAFWSWSVRLQ